MDARFIGLGVSSAVVPLFLCLIVAFSTGALGGDGRMFGSTPRSTSILPWWGDGDAWWSAPSTECDESLHGSFGAYRGCQTKSLSGSQCLRWDDEYARMTAAGYDHFDWDMTTKGPHGPQLLSADNYCRNIGGLQPMPWCYTDNNHVEFTQMLVEKGDEKEDGKIGGLRDPDRYVNNADTERNESVRVWWEFCKPEVEHACWIVPPHGHGSRMETNLAYTGFDPQIAPEGMADFDRLLLANFLAVLTSSCAFAVSVWLKIKTTSFASAYSLDLYKTYTTHLMIYFGVSVFTNLAGAMSFMGYRCVFHNLVSEGPGGKWTKLLYLMAAVFSSLLTNGVMDRLLLARINMFNFQIERSEEQARKEARWKRLAKIAVSAALLLLVLCLLTMLLVPIPALPVYLVAGLAGLVLLVGLLVLARLWVRDNLGRATATQIVMCLLLAVSGLLVSLTLNAMGGDGQAGSGLLLIVALYRGGGFAFAMLHLLISLSLVQVLLAIAKTEQHGQSRTLIVFTVIGVSSTVIVYLNWVLGFMNLYFLMPIDSVLNDLCLAVVSFSAPTSDVQDAKRAEVAELALTIGNSDRVHPDASELGA